MLHAECQMHTSRQGRWPTEATLARPRNLQRATSPPDPHRHRPPTNNQQPTTNNQQLTNHHAITAPRVSLANTRTPMRRTRPSAPGVKRASTRRPLVPCRASGAHEVRIRRVHVVRSVWWSVWWWSVWCGAPVWSGVRLLYGRSRGLQYSKITRPPVPDSGTHALFLSHAPPALSPCQSPFNPPPPCHPDGPQRPPNTPPHPLPGKYSLSPGGVECKPRSGS